MLAMSSASSPISSTPLFDQFGPRVDFMHPITLRKGTLLDALESMTTKLRTPHRPEHWTRTDAERLEEVARFIRSNEKGQP